MGAVESKPLGFDPTATLVAGGHEHGREAPRSPDPWLGQAINLVTQRGDLEISAYTNPM